MLSCIALWIFSIGVGTLHHHLPEDLQNAHDQHETHNHTKDDNADHCHHTHHDESNQACGICFLIHHNNPVVISYQSISFAVLAPFAIPTLATPYLLSFLDDSDSRALSLRGPPLG